MKDFLPMVNGLAGGILRSRPRTTRAMTVVRTGGRSGRVTATATATVRFVFWLSKGFTRLGPTFIRRGTVMTTSRCGSTTGTARCRMRKGGRPTTSRGTSKGRAGGGGSIRHGRTLDRGPRFRSGVIEIPTTVLSTRGSSIRVSAMLINGV